MSRTVWRPSKGREIEDIVKKINEIHDQINSPSTTEGGVKTYQNLIAVKKADGTFVLQLRTKDGLIESPSFTKL